MKTLLSLLLLLSSFASYALTIHAVELGIGKFHRMDNKVHPYSEGNVWIPMILPEGADLKDTPLIVQRSPEVFTVFFSSLEEVIQSVVKISKEQGRKINVLNIHAHGMPGAMFFPQTNNMRDSLLCANWRRHSAANDEKNYKMYYSSVSMINLKLVRAFSAIGDSKVTRVLNPLLRDPCMTGLGAFERQAKKVDSFKSYFADDLEMKFLSCSVSLGRAGKDFVEGIGELFLNSKEGSVTASQNISLGDWSTPEGLGFWDGHSWKQVREDNKNYVQNRRDSDIAQPGAIRTAFIDENGKMTSVITKDVQLMTWKQE